MSESPGDPSRSSLPSQLSLLDAYKSSGISNISDCHFAGYAAYADLYKANVEAANTYSSWMVLAKAFRLSSNAMEGRESISMMVKAICQSRSALVEECGYIAPCWPALITVKDVVVLSIASPYYAKGNLFAYARGCSDAEKLELLCQAAEPLAFMHNIGNVHGNVRPENFCIGDDGKVYMTDTSLNLVLRQADNQDYTGIPSSWMYKPGEELESGICTIESEVYSFISIIYSIYTDKPPFSNISRLHHFRGPLQIINQGHAEILTEKPAAMSDGLWEIVKAGWVRNSAQRPPMNEVLDRLLRLVVQNPE